MLQPLHTTLALQICPERVTFSIHVKFCIPIHALNFSDGPFPSVKSQIHREQVQFIGQGTENSSSSSSSRISSNSTVIPKIKNKKPSKSVTLFLNFRYFTSLKCESMAFLELRFLIGLLSYTGNFCRQLGIQLKLEQETSQRC